MNMEKKNPDKVKAVKILHRDEHHLVVDKPAGMGCLHDRRDMGRQNLIEVLKRDHPTASLVHRLDIETSGLLLVALHRDALRHLSQQFMDRVIKKEYVTFVSSYVAFEEMTVKRPVGPILRKGHSTIRRKGKDAITHLIKERGFKGFTKLQCFPKTGRTHQIRIHLADMGLPIVGDHKYGGIYPYLSKIKRNYQKSRRHPDYGESPLIKRVALHAKSIEYIPFECEDTVKHECPEPKDFAQFTEKLEKFA